MNNDTIYRQAAIDEFKSYGERVDTATQLWTIIGCADMIRNLPPAEPETCAYWDRESNICALHRPSTQPDWIPCNEKLPEELTRVLVCTDQGFVCIAYLKINHKEKDRPWLVYGADPDVRGNIVKWMQLPKP